MNGNDKKRAWEHRLGVGTINFGDLGCVLLQFACREGDFDVDSPDLKVGSGAEKITNFLNFPKLTKVHEMSRNDPRKGSVSFDASLEAGSRG